MPQGPELKSISNSTPVIGSDYFIVSAIIEGIEQKQACCGTNCDRSDCEMHEWYFRPDPDIEPNPPCIPNAGGHPDFADYDDVCKKPGNPKVYYTAYPQAGETIHGSVDMAYNTITGRYEAGIPLAGLQMGDEISYYIVAADSAGNVISQVPDSTTAPCTSATSWNTDYETPPINNCDFMNGYELCGDRRQVAPDCGAAYTVNDPAGDTCGEPDDEGTQQVVSGIDLVDILGFSAGAGKGFGDLPGQDVVCAKVGLKAPPPNNSGGVIDAYILVLFNPDIYDPNPADIHMENSFAITYAPEAAGADPNLVKVLWDGDCLTDPDTPDILACKIFIGSDSETRLKISYSNDNLVFIAQNDLDWRTIIGNSSKETVMSFYTGAIQLSGGTPFWITDITAGLTLQKEAQTISSPPIPILHPAYFRNTMCQTNGVGDSPVCSSFMGTSPDSNECVMEIGPSPDKLFTGYYNLYHSLTYNRADATLIEELSGAANFPEDGSDVYTKSYSITLLDGRTHYFFLSAVNATGDESFETPQSNWNSTSCTVANVDPPEPPANFTCATPVGFDKSCKCEWIADYISDPSLYGFYLKRDGVPLNPEAAILSQSFTDSDATLENGYSYTYELRAVDIGGNYSPWTSTGCMPEDLKPPAMVDTLSIIADPGVIGVDFAWEPGPEEDIGEYNIYACEQTVTSTCGADSEGNADGYSLLATIPQPDPPETIFYSDNSSFGHEDSTWCFYVETCDDCVSAGTCPSKSSPNCSYFNTMSTYRKCIFIGPMIDPVAPLFPENQAAGPLPGGESCRITWDAVCRDEEGDFSDCNFPATSELMGYYVMRSEAIGGSCLNIPVPSPSYGTPAGFAPISYDPAFTDDGLTNGMQYCYRVHAYNAYNYFSRNEPVPSPVSCIPGDIQPPDKPEIVVPVAFTNSTCTPEWSEVEDDDTVTYNVYRCEGTEAQCNDSSKFLHLGSEQQLYSCEDTTDTQCEDWALSPDTQYVYCITAKDAIPNESDIYDSKDTINCAPCMATSKCVPPTGVIAGEKGPNYYGFDVYWTKSSSDYGSGEGYSIYLCTGSTADTCSTTSLASDINGDYSETPYTITDAGVSYDGYFYIGVSYEGSDCGESMIAVSLNSVTIGPTPPPCLPDIRLDIDGYFMKKELAACVEGDSDVNCQKVLAACAASSMPGCADSARKIASSPAAGITIELFDTTTGTVVKSKTTLTDGSVQEFGLFSANITTSDTFSVRARLPEGYWNEMFAYAQSGGAGCEPDSDPGECVIVLKSDISLGYFTTVEIDAIELIADPAMYGGQFANPDCDDKITLKDLALVKKRFFTDASKYHPSADFNLDGKIDLKDLAMIKASFNKSIGEKGTDASTMGGICDPDM